MAGRGEGNALPGVTEKEISKMAKVEGNTPNINYVKAKLEKYSLARKWNLFVKSIEEAKNTWDSLQKEIDVVGEEEIERTYPTIAQKHLSHFRKIEFHWMIRLFVDYYRGAGGLDEMYIILPPETPETPKAQETKTIKVEEEKKNGSK